MLMIDRKITNKGLFAIIGECFRTGGQFSRVRGRPESFDAQKKACESHIDLINFLEKKHSIKIDIVLNSYSTKYDADIVNWYGDNLVNHKFYPEVIGYNNIFSTSFDLIKDKKKYDFIFFHRVDLIFKSYFKKVFDIHKQKITFPFAMPGVGNPYNLISELMVFIPSNHFDKKIILDHWLLDRNPKIRNDVGYFINTIHRANTSYEWNPIYKTANRPQKKVWGLSPSGDYTKTGEIKVKEAILNEQHQKVFCENPGKDFEIKYFL